MQDGTKLDEMLPNQRAFLNLKQEQRDAFVQHFREANRLFAQKRVFETLESLAEAEKIFTESPEVYNLKGSCYVEMRAFDKALACFTKASGISTNTTSITFNIGEVYFVTKQWAKAIETFESLLNQLPSQESQLAKLAQFKILLCKIKLGKKEEFIILAEKYDYLDDSPYYYFSQAAIAYEEEDLLAAEQWLARASRIFRDPALLSPWQDTLVEFGYIKSFYGGED